MQPINHITAIQIEDERAKKYVSKSGVEIHLDINKHSADNVFWTNPVFEDYETGETIFVRPMEVARVYGSFETGGQGEGTVLPDGRKAYFFKPDMVFLRIGKDGEMKPKKGCCLGVRVKKEAPKTSLWIPEHYENEWYEDRFEVTHLGEPLDEEVEYQANASTVLKRTEAYPATGDVVVVNRFGGLPLFSEYNVKLDNEYYLIAYTDIMGVVGDGGVYPLGDRVKIEYKEELSHGGVLLTKEVARRCREGKVVCAGLLCEDVALGDVVYFGKNEGWVEKEGSRLTFIMREKELFGVRLHHGTR